MDKIIIPESLLTELKKLGYSDNAIKEIVKWYDYSLYEGVASF